MNEQPLTQEYCLQLIEDYKNGKADGTTHKYCELATFLDVNPVTISRWRAVRKMSEKTMRQIAFFCCKSAGGSVRNEDTEDKTAAKISAILDAIMVSDMCAECKIKAYNIIKGIE